MATIKLQDGKVILKDGKASCACCAPPKGCCMYPAQSFLQDYTYDDLPDSVSVAGVVLNKQDGGGENGIYYSDGQNYIQWVFTLWLLIGPITQFNTFESSCLIGNYLNIPFEGDPVLPPISVEDQFASSYTLSGFSQWQEYIIFFESLLVSRASLCRWNSEWVTFNVGNIESSGTCEIQMQLSYVGQNIFGDLFYIPNWTITWGVRNWQVYYNNGDPIQELGGEFAVKYSVLFEGNGISSPVGIYDEGTTIVNWTIQ
jgi:hypothetical protein